MAGREGSGPSNSIWMDSAGDGTIDSLGVDGAEGYDWRRSTNAVEISGEGFKRSIHERPKGLEVGTYTRLGI